MKLHVAVTVLASFAASLTSVSAGECLSAVTAYAGQQQDVQWTDSASYYTINNNANYNNGNANYYNDDQQNNQQQAEENAEQAEQNIQAQMESLAEALGIEFDEGEQDGQDGNYNYNQYQAMR